MCHGSTIGMCNSSTEDEYVNYVYPQEHGNHTDELEEDGKIHLRIDYKVSGLGSHSCGPELAEKYRLQEKEIVFSFSMQPFMKGERDYGVK